MLSLIDDTQTVVADTVEKVRKAVVATMGPNGTLSLISIGTANKVTKDGVTVARALKFDDPFAECVNKLITEPAIKTDVECGDGTTTTILLTAEFYRLFSKFQNYRERLLIEDVAALTIRKLTAAAIMVTKDSPELYDMALTSSNQDAKLSKVVTDIYKQTSGGFPEIELKEGASDVDRVVYTQGLPMHMSFSNALFSATGNGGATVFSGFIPVVLDVRLVHTPELFKTLADVSNKLRDAVDQEHTTIMIIARSIDNEVNKLLTGINNGLKNCRFVGVQTNAGGSVGTLLMQDISVILGVPMFSSLEGVLDREVPLVNETILIDSTRSIISELSHAAQSRIALRVSDLQKEIDTADREDRFSQRMRFTERRMRDLKGELVTVFVGGETASDVKERKDRFEDVTKAVRSALINGILPGVGTALLEHSTKALNEIEDALLATLDGNKYKLSTDQVSEILQDLEKVFAAPYIKLMTGVVEIVGTTTPPTVKDTDEPICVNLATGKEGTAKELGIYDTAYAAITALKGGVQTARTLASIDSVMMGQKLSAVQMSN